jgi:hypothetical protein
VLGTKNGGDGEGQQQFTRPDPTRPVTVIATLQPTAIHFLARFADYLLMKTATAGRLKHAQYVTWFLDNNESEQDCILT